MDTSKLSKLLKILGIGFMIVGLILAAIETNNVLETFNNTTGQGGRFLKAFGVAKPSFGRLFTQILTFDNPNKFPASLLWLGGLILTIRFSFNFIRKPQDNR